MRSDCPVVTASTDVVRSVLPVFGCPHRSNSDNPVNFPKTPCSTHLTTVLHMRGKLFLLIAFAVFPAAVVAQPKPIAAEKVVTTPKEFFGFDMGEDYCLANYKQMEGYWKKIEGQTD